MNKHPKIAFMTTLGVNVGDEFIREGICSFLDDLFNYWEPFYVNKHDLLTLYQPVEGEVRTLRDKFLDSDIIIQAGAPVYWKIGNSTSYNVEWADELWKKRIFQIGPQKPIFNIGAGACQPYRDFAKTFLLDSACIQFAQDAHSACRWTSVRDPLSSQILFALRLDHDVLPCPAFHAPRRRRKNGLNRHSKFLGINVMPFAGHYKLSEDIDEKKWDTIIKAFLSNIRKRHSILFIAHDEKEKEFMRHYLVGNEVIFYSTHWTDYLKTYQQCKAIIANRIHGAVCASGFGIPAVIIGNDSRLLIGDYLQIPSIYVNEIEVDLLVDLIEKSIHKQDEERERLLALREESAKRYCEAIQNGLENPKRNTNYPDKEKKFCFASFHEMLSPPFRNFMKTMNCFARRWGLYEYEEYPEIWSYPWAWFNALSKIEWGNTHVLFVDHELSPMPWFLASLGVDVSLVGRERHMVCLYHKILEKTGLNVNLEFESNGLFPFESERFDFVSSLTFTHPLKKGIKTFDEMVRVLKPGGKLVLSFILETSESRTDFLKPKGITFTRSQFEEIICNHPAFVTNGLVHEWKTEDNALALQRHCKGTLPSPLIGCTILQKKEY